MSDDGAARSLRNALRPRAGASCGWGPETGRTPSCGSCMTAKKGGRIKNKTDRASRKICEPALPRRLPRHPSSPAVISETRIVHQNIIALAESLEKIIKIHMSELIHKIP